MADPFKMTLASVPVIVVVGSAFSAGFGAAHGAVGAKILSDAGHAGYSVLGATRNGAVGGAVLGPVQALLMPKQTREHAALNMAVTCGLAAAQGALGSAILRHASDPWLDAGRSAASGAVGAATLCAAYVAIFGVIYGLGLISARGELSEPSRPVSA